MLSVCRKGRKQDGDKGISEQKGKKRGCLMSLKCSCLIKADTDSDVQRVYMKLPNANKSLNYD